MTEQDDVGYTIDKLVALQSNFFCEDLRPISSKLPSIINTVVTYLGVLLQQSFLRYAFVYGT